MAISDIGTGICAWGYSSIADAKRDALATCTGYVPQSMRKKVKCHVVWENGEITDPDRVALLRKPYRMPVTIETYNGSSKRKETATGYMEFGPAPDKLSRSASIHLADGHRICSGVARLRRVKFEFEFTAKCESSKSLKGLATVIGLREIGGLQRLALDLTIRDDPNYIRVVAK